MIDENELLVWLDSAKRAAKIPPIIPEGKYTMIVEIVPLMGKIRELAANQQTGGDKNDTEDEIGQ